MTIVNKFHFLHSRRRPRENKSTKPPSPYFSPFFFIIQSPGCCSSLQDCNGCVSVRACVLCGWSNFTLARALIALPCSAKSLVVSECQKITTTHWNLFGGFFFSHPKLSTDFLRWKKCLPLHHQTYSTTTFPCMFACLNLMFGSNFFFISLTLRVVVVVLCGSVRARSQQREGER